MPAGAHTAVEAREEQAKESRRSSSWEGNKDFCPLGVGDLIYSEPFYRIPPLRSRRDWHLFYFFCRLLLLRS